jgi:4-carboxymuconolactone decarboxylase
VTTASALTQTLVSALDRTTLPSPERELVLLLAAIVRSPDACDEMLELARDRGIPADLAAEIALQAALFAGFPRAITALASLRRRLGAEPAAPRALTAAADLDSWRARGAALFRTIYAGNAERVLADLDRFHPELADWVLVDAYGRILARSAIEPRVRELAAVAALIVSGDLRQLSSHARGALHCGATIAAVHAACELAAALIDAPAAERARQIIVKTAGPGSKEG